MIPQTDVLKSTAHFTDAQTVLIKESFEPELGPAPSPQHWKTSQGYACKSERGKNSAGHDN